MTISIRWEGYLVVLLLLSAGLSAQAHAPAEAADPAMPGHAFLRSDGHYAWLSADSISEGGSAEDRGLVSANESEIIGENLAAAADGHCGIGTDFDRTVGPRPDVPTAFETARYIFLGSITGAAGGFYYAIPGTLFRVVTQEVLKGPQSVGVEHFFFLPVGDFTVGAARICRTNPNFPEILPAVGDEVLVISEGTRGDSALLLGVSGASGVVVLPERGKVHLPARYEEKREGEEGELSRERFLSWIRTLGGGSQ